MRADIEQLAVGDRCLVHTGSGHLGGRVRRIYSEKSAPKFEVEQDGCSPAQIGQFDSLDVFGDSPAGREALRIRLCDRRDELAYLQAKTEESITELETRAREETGSESRTIMIGRPPAPAVLQPTV